MSSPKQSPWDWYQEERRKVTAWKEEGSISEIAAAAAMEDIEKEFMRRWSPHVHEAQDTDTPQKPSQPHPTFSTSIPATSTNMNSSTVASTSTGASTTTPLTSAHAHQKGT
jgi:hypothetical protein